MKSGERLRVGMLGAGWVTAYHLRAWQRQSHRAHVVAIADPVGEATRKRSAEFSIACCYDSAEAMFSDFIPDIVDICAPREFHAELVRLAASKGSAILCQKPLATDLTSAQTLAVGISERERLMVHENWRFRAYYRRLKQWLGAGLAGDLRHVTLEFLSSGMIPDRDGERPALVRQPFLRTLDRLLVMEILIHHLDTLRFLFGEMEVCSARLSRTNDDIIGEDVATLCLRLSDGTPVHVTGNLAVHGAPPTPRDHLRVFGSDSTIELDGSRLTVTGGSKIEEHFDLDATYQGSYDAVIAHFLDGLERGTPFETAPADNLQTLELVETVYRLSSSQPR